MSELLTVNIVYAGGEHYRILEVFTKSGGIDRQLLASIYRELMGKDGVISDWELGPFENLEEIERFAFRVSEQMQAVGAHVLSVFDYNLGLEHLVESENFLKIFADHGHFLPNPGAKVGKSGLFERFFKGNE